MAIDLIFSSICIVCAICAVVVKDRLMSIVFLMSLTIFISAIYYRFGMYVVAISNLLLYLGGILFSTLLILSQISIFDNKSYTAKHLAHSKKYLILILPATFFAVFTYFLSINKNYYKQIVDIKFNLVAISNHVLIKHYFTSALLLILITIAIFIILNVYRNYILNSKDT